MGPGLSIYDLSKGWKEERKENGQTKTGSTKIGCREGDSRSIRSRCFNFANSSRVSIIVKKKLYLPFKPVFKKNKTYSVTSPCSLLNLHLPWYVWNRTCSFGQMCSLFFGLSRSQITCSNGLPKES